MLQGGQAVARGPSGGGRGGGDAVTVASVETTTAEVGVAVMDERAKAKMQGYEGDPCGECGNFTLVRNGTCLKCNTCGAYLGVQLTTSERRLR